MSDNRRPAVRLKPKADARRIRHGYPWVWAEDLVLDRRTRALAPGTLARLEDGDRRPVGLFAVNPVSKIAARRLDADSEAEPDGAWFSDRLDRAEAIRRRLYEQPFWRWVHAEADHLAGVVIDRFGDAVVIQPNAAWAERQLDALCEAVAVRPGIETIVVNRSSRVRALEGLTGETELLKGRLNGPVTVPMNGALYLADLVGGQKTGLFFDQRENHRAAARLARDERVLDVFCHVGGFGLAALASGAASCLAVDASGAALDLARGGARAMGAEARFETRQGDAFEVMQALAEDGARFGVVVSDPPAFAPGKPALEAGLRAYERAARLAAALVTPGGFLVLCSCSHAADLWSFRRASVRGIGRAGRSARLIRIGFAAPDHPEHPMLGETGYLKSLIFALD